MANAYSLAVVLLSSIAMAALCGWFVFGRGNEKELSVVQAHIEGLEEQTKSAQNKIDTLHNRFFAVAERLELSLNQLTDRVVALEADFAATASLTGRSEVAFFRNELQRLSKANAGIHHELSAILRHIENKQNPAPALEQTEELED